MENQIRNSTIIQLEAHEPTREGGEKESGSGEEEKKRKRKEKNRGEILKISKSLESQQGSKIRQDLSKKISPRPLDFTWKCRSSNCDLISQTVPDAGDETSA